MALACGDLATAKQWAAGLAQARVLLVLARAEEETLLLARLSIIEHQPEQALGLLEPLLRDARAQGREYREQQILVQQARAFAASGAHTQAQQTLVQVLTQAMSEGLLRLFLEEGPAMETWLKRLLPDLREEALSRFVRTLLDTFAIVPHSQDGLAAPRPAVRMTRLSPPGASGFSLAGCRGL